MMTNQNTAFSSIALDTVAGGSNTPPRTMVDGNGIVHTLPSLGNITPDPSEVPFNQYGSQTYMDANGRMQMLPSMAWAK